MTNVDLTSHLARLSEEEVLTDLDVYQDWVKSTTLDGMQERYGAVYGALKLAAEAGEVANVIGKTMHRTSSMTDDEKGRVFDEMGDVLWYLAYLSNSLAFRLDDVLDYNMSKINQRMANARAEEDSN